VTPSPLNSPTLRVCRSDDADQVKALDTSFSTDERYVVHRKDGRVSLQREAVDAPISKSFPLDLAADPWEHGFVCSAGGQLCGFIGGQIEQWNRRLVIWHFYVDKKCRRLGLGRALMQAMLGWGRAHGASLAWVETSNLNVPGVHAYERLGFQICGFDESLYVGTASRNEFALFMAGPVER
jgi:ribosomal protein S18 acetylase RimI-like enzyme